MRTEHRPVFVSPVLNGDGQTSTAQEYFRARHEQRFADSVRGPSVGPHPLRHGQRPAVAAALESADELSVRTAVDESTYVIAVYGEMDLSNVEQAERALRRAERTSVQEIVLDLSGLRFMDSTGIKLLLDAHERSRADGDRLSLLRSADAVHRIVELSGVAQQLPFVG